MQEYYPLTAAQKMHHNWILKYKTQQVSGVSVVASLKSPLDFGLLKKCIQLEMERYGCMRVRFTKPDAKGEVRQYIVKKDNRDIPIKDLSMIRLPEGYNGFFIHMDHRLIDSCGIVVMINDVMQLYTHYRFQSDYPDDLADYEKVLEKDLKRANNEKRFAKDKKFWDDQLDALGEPLYSDIQG